MSKRLTTLALVSAAVLGMASAANAQAQNSNGGRANDPELNNNVTAPSGNGATTMQKKQNGNMGTTGQGAAPANPQPGNKTPAPGGAGRVNQENQQ